jgi:hypothetical protein
MSCRYNTTITAYNENGQVLMGASCAAPDFSKGCKFLVAPKPIQNATFAADQVTFPAKVVKVFTGAHQRHAEKTLKNPRWHGIPIPSSLRFLQFMVLLSLIHIAIQIDDTTDFLNLVYLLASIGVVVLIVIVIGTLLERWRAKLRQ